LRGTFIALPGFSQSRKVRHGFFRNSGPGLSKLKIDYTITTYSHLPAALKLKFDALDEPAIEKQSFPRRNNKQKHKISG